MALPVVAIVGRPNVGKSMLFNKLTGRRTAIVEDTPGVTRDRIYGKCDWNGREFQVVDTGGIEPSTRSEMLLFMRRQAEIAIETADVIIMVTDVKVGMTAADQEVANMLLRSKKPVCLAVNKCDSVGPTNPDVYEFYALGLGDPIEVSAIHGHGTGDLLDFCVANFPPETEDEEEDDVIRVAIVGKPNVGKSSLLNQILGMERTIAAIDRSDVCLILIDANEGVTEQDTKIAGLAHEAGKACVIVANKWDTVEKETKTMDEKTADIRRDLSYMTYAPIVFLSALTGARVNRLFEVINAVSNNAAMRITTGMLNNILADATARVQPPSDKGRRLKIYYMTQVGIKPPHFVVFCNDARLFHFSYQRYLENQLRAVFGLEGTPIRLTIRQKGDKED